MDGNKKFKDNLFRHFFKDSENFVSLYKELSKKTIESDDVKFYDISSRILSKTIQNDVSYLTKDNRFIILIEHMSSSFINLVLRLLIYYVELVRIYLKENEFSLLSKKLVKIPTAELYVAYNGKTNIKNKTINLSKHFFVDTGQIKVTVKVRNINYNQLKYKKEKNTMVGYAYFVHCTRGYLGKGLTLSEALEKAKEECLKKGLLTEYLNREEFLTLALETITWEQEIGFAREEERHEMNLHFVYKLIKDGVQIEKIMEYTDLSEEEIEDLIDELKIISF